MSADTKKFPVPPPESQNTEQKPEETRKKSGLPIKSNVKAGPIGNNQDGGYSS